MSLQKQVIPFQNEPVEVLYTYKTGPDGLQYYFFELTTIARLMNIEHPHSKIDSHHFIEDWTRPRNTTLVSEAGLYQLVFSCKSLSVRQGLARNWIFDVMIPSIKQHSEDHTAQFERLNINGLSVPSCVSNDILQSFKHIIETLERQMKQKDGQIERLIRSMDEQLMRRDEMLAYRERDIEMLREQLFSKDKQVKNALALMELKESQLCEVITIVQKKDMQLEQQFNVLRAVLNTRHVKIDSDKSDDEELPQNHDTVLMIVRENTTTFKGIAAKRRYVDQQKQKLRYHESMIVVHSKRPDPKRDWNAAMDMVKEMGIKDRCQILPNLKRIRFEQVKDADSFEKGLKKMFNVSDAV
ncbi:bro [Spodoptera frugiperda granulovirus]|uniref:Bro n=1 Tax=Spodoptera frugiperda granulovirus TaxID=307454 RepID=A0A0C5AQ87_9BBAC|nr:bro [Spodoptera frugiperda granulovirus]AJK91756.1 bro [Spodoptera frugiperda granulovirus]AXS01119.1 bro-g [Spodoptera frugiperda granulovirus]